MLTISNKQTFPIEYSKQITLPNRSICPVVIQTKKGTNTDNTLVDR